MVQWIEDMDPDERGEFYDDLTSAAQWDKADALVYVFNEIKERKEIGQDFYVEFATDSEGDISGPSLVFDAQGDYLNLSVPLFDAEVKGAIEGKNPVDMADGLVALIEAKAKVLAPYIAAVKAVM